MENIIIAIVQSRIRHAAGFLKKEDMIVAPKPSKLKKVMLAIHAPMPKFHTSAPSYCRDRMPIKTNVSK